MSKINWTLGTDPEVFLEETSGQFYSAYNGFGSIIKGTKDKPELTEYGAIQIDGMAVEFNTNPTTSIQQFSDLIQHGLDDVEHRHPDHVVSKSCVKHFDQEFLDRQPKAASEMGCDPDFNPYMNGMAFSSPNEKALMRTAGGHLHIGWRGPDNFVSIEDHDHIVMCIEAAKQLDWVLGTWANVEDKEGQQRRRLYGKYGAFRPKPYGLEYRYLSNFWVFEEAHRKTVAKRAIAGLQLLVDDYSFTNEKGGMFHCANNRSNFVEEKLQPYMEKLNGTA